MNQIACFCGASLDKGSCVGSLARHAGDKPDNTIALFLRVCDLLFATGVKNSDIPRSPGRSVTLACCASLVTGLPSPFEGHGTASKLRRPSQPHARGDVSRPVYAPVACLQMERWFARVAGRTGAQRAHAACRSTLVRL
jgi:hypothetical protein